MSPDNFARTVPAFNGCHAGGGTRPTAALQSTPLALVVLAIAAWSASPAATVFGQVVLRDLSILPDRQIVDWDAGAVILDDRTRLPWHRVLEGPVPEGRRQEFQSMQQSVGETSFRVHQRMSIGDWRAAAQAAEQLPDEVLAVRSQTSLLAAAALLRARLDDSRREAAVVPLISVLRIVAEHPSWTTDVPGWDQLQIDPATGFCHQLLPVWFETESAQQSWGTIRDWLDEPPAGPPGLGLYAASLAAAAGDLSAARAWLAELDPPGELAPWVQVVEVMVELVAGDTSAEGPVASDALRNRQRLPTLPRAALLLAVGRHRAASDDPQRQRQGLLNLMAVPAICRADGDELAAAALAYAHQTLDSMGESRTAAALRREIAESYAHTHFGRALRHEK